MTSSIVPSRFIGTELILFCATTSGSLAKYGEFAAACISF